MSPFAQLARSPCSAPHSHQCWGLCVSPSRPQTSEQRPQTSTQQHLAAPAAALFTTISPASSASPESVCFGVSSESFTWSSSSILLFFFFFPSLHHATKMLIALQSQSLKSLTYCVDSIPRLLQPFMWVLMYCHLQAL